MAIYAIDNRSPVDKAFRTDTGFKIIEAGKSGKVEDAVELTQAQLDALAADSVTVAEGGAERGLSDLTVKELRAVAHAEDIDLGDAKKPADIIAAIELAREEKAQA